MPKQSIASLEIEAVEMIRDFTDELHIFVEGDKRYLSYTNSEKQAFWSIIQCVADKAIQQSLHTLVVANQVKEYRKIHKKRDQVIAELNDEEANEIDNTAPI